MCTCAWSCVLFYWNETAKHQKLTHLNYARASHHLKHKSLLLLCGHAKDYYSFIRWNVCYSIVVVSLDGLVWATSFQNGNLSWQFQLIFFCSVSIQMKDKISGKYEYFCFNVVSWFLHSRLLVACLECSILLCCCLRCAVCNWRDSMSTYTIHTRAHNNSLLLCVCAVRSILGRRIFILSQFRVSDAAQRAKLLRQIKIKSYFETARWRMMMN